MARLSFGRPGLVDDDSPPDDLGLLLDPQLLPQEVDVTDPEAEDLALTQPATRRHHRHRPVAGRESLDDRLHLLGRPRLHLALFDFGRPDGVGLARVAGDEAVVDGGVEHGRDVR